MKKLSLILNRFFIGLSVLVVAITALAVEPTVNVPAAAPQVLPAAPVAAAPQAIPPKPTAMASPTSTMIPAPPTLDAKGYLLIDANSGYIIAQNNAGTRMAPASLTKLMTMYVVSGALKSGRIHLDDQVTISENAWRTGGSRMFVQVGTQVAARDLINGIIVVSGNDACVAMSEHVAGSESSFVDLMNQTAAQLGMKDTHYADATGLPNPDNYSTPYDLAILARAIIHHYPEDYTWYSQKEMTYNKIRQPNRNLLLFSDNTVDGLKTGHTDDAGYCLIASAKRNNDMRLIAVVMGSSSSKQRAADAEALLNYGYRFYETHKLYGSNVPLTNARVWFGKDKKTALGLAQDLHVTVPAGQYNQLKPSMLVNKEVDAPVQTGQAHGKVVVSLNNKVIAAQPLVALADNPKAGFFSRLVDHIAKIF